MDDHLATLAGLCSRDDDLDALLSAALPQLMAVAHAHAGVVLRPGRDQTDVVARAGRSLDPDTVAQTEVRSPLSPLSPPHPAPLAWAPAGSGSRAQHVLPGAAGVLVLDRDRPVSSGPGVQGDTCADIAVALLDQALARLQVQDELMDLRTRVDNAQKLANMGDYDWHVATDTNRWSDQLYRIYGYEPQTFNASYDRFLDHIHPDDREKVQAIHQQAYATGEPYEMVERIVRPDGSTRYLASNGEVIIDSDGKPVRMRGTCVDITERVLAEQEREQTAALSAALAQVQVRRRQALEINDNVVQGLTAASLALTGGDLARSSVYLEHTLDAARRMMNDWLDPIDGEPLRAGDLVRENASVVGPGWPSASAANPAGRCRILLVDDNPDIRDLLRAQLEPLGRYDIVGEAGDGQAAIDAAAELRPDVVLLDLAMPRMDGLQALPQILEAVPGVRVIVLSGFDADSMAPKALSAGAARYVEKGLRMNLPEVIEGVLNAPAA
jgi:PAS domain S-box-containing protein